MFISKGFNGKVFKISNLPPKSKLAHAWQQLKNFIDSCCCIGIMSVMGKMTMRPENFQSEKGSNASGRYHQREKRERERCINMRHAI